MCTFPLFFDNIYNLSFIPVLNLDLIIYLYNQHILWLYKCASYGLSISDSEF